MKRLLDTLANGRRSQGHFYNLGDASLSDNRCYDFSEGNIFKYHPFDSDGCDTSRPGHGILLNSRVKSIDNSEERVSRSLTSPHLSSSILTNTLDLQSKNDFPLISGTSSNLGGSIMGTEKENNCESEKKKKDRKNVYSINISNSKYFLIGSQKTINVNETQVIKQAAQDYAQHIFKNHSCYFKADFQNLLDFQERLANKYILLISQYMDDQWKEFLKYLGLGITTLETIQFRNSNHRILCVYDALHKYVTLFPNTSLAFVIFVLDQVHQVIVIEKLVEELAKEPHDL